VKKKQLDAGAGSISGKAFVLLIWEEVPESTKLLLIPSEELNEEDVEVLRIANGHLQNTCDLTTKQAAAIDKISNALCSNEKYIDERYVGTRWAMTLTKYIVSDDATIEGKRITSVYRTGYVM
jgi:hypothetical protein